MKRETGWFPNGYSAGIAANSGAAGATSEAKASGNSLSSKAPGRETAKSVAEASWKELTGQQGYTSSFREAGEAASSHLTPDSVAGVIAVAQAKPAGVAAGAVAPWPRQSGRPSARPHTPALLTVERLPTPPVGAARQPNIFARKTAVALGSQV